ncbi:uncharacterized protein F5147DRAFT_706769, partial [Suillus discolor]
MGANGIMQPGQPLSHDTVQKWIDEATTGAGILGCAQYWFMFAPVGQRWSLAMVRWWGGWADCEQTDYSDALAPFSREAESSLAGEAGTHEGQHPLRSCAMVHASVTADMQSNDSLRSLTSMVQATSSCLKAAWTPTSNTARRRSPLHPSPSPPHLAVQKSHGHAHITPTTRPLPSAAAHTASTQQLPSNGLVIPRLPLVRSNGLKTPKAESWRDIITHWLVGDPDRGLKTPLKDWPQEWYQGPNRKLAMQYQNRAVVAREFIN